MIIETPYEPHGSYMFKILLEYVLENPILPLDLRAFSSVINYFQGNNKLDGSFYPLLVHFIKVALKAEIKQVQESVFSLLSGLLDENREIIYDQNHEKLIQILEPHIHAFNRRALTVVAKLSKATLSPVIRDVFISIASSFLDFIQKFFGHGQCCYGGKYFFVHNR